jgi:aryl-alcohol dehydrogenase-like predicted oxidoreductase
VALAWLRARPTVVAPIVGARTSEQLADNLGSVEWELTAEELDLLDRASAIEEQYPYRMIRVYGTYSQKGSQPR